MKKAIVIFGALFLVSLILFSCNNSSTEQKNLSSENDAPKTATVPSENKSAEDKPVAETASTNSSADLPVVKTSTTGDKYVDWGSKPVETADGPAEPWTMPFMMCQGPPFLEGKLKASSTLAPQGKKKYSANNICDDDPRTAWVEGKSDYGVGEFLELKWVPMGDGEISILNGYQSDKSTWEDNSRVKKMMVSVGGKELCVVELADVMGVQKFKIPGLVTTTQKAHEYHIDGPIRFTIKEVYPGLKYKDTAISGLFSCGG